MLIVILARQSRKLLSELDNVFAIIRTQPSLELFHRVVNVTCHPLIADDTVQMIVCYNYVDISFCLPVSIWPLYVGLVSHWTKPVMEIESNL